MKTETEVTNLSKRFVNAGEEMKEHRPSKPTRPFSGHGRKRIFVAALLGLFTSGAIYLGVAAAVAVPQKFTYQGVLEKDGMPVPNAAVPMVFTWYDSAADGTALGDTRFEGDDRVPVRDGHFSVELNMPSTDIAKTDELYLGVAVGEPDSEEEPQPLDRRQQVLSVPFAARAQHSDSAYRADSATTAGSADSAGHAASADTATRAASAKKGYDNEEFWAHSLSVAGNTSLNGEVAVGGLVKTVPGADRLHLNAKEDIYLLAEGGDVFVSGAWGGAGNLYVEGNVIADHNTWGASSETATEHGAWGNVTKSATCPEGTYVAGIAINYLSSTTTCSDPMGQNCTTTNTSRVGSIRLLCKGL